MDADEFRRVLSDVIRDELGVADVEIAGRWAGGEMVLKPGKEGVQEKRIPLDSLFHKVVMIRDKLRVLEQKINGHPKLGGRRKGAASAVRDGVLRLAHHLQRALRGP